MKYFQKKQGHSYRAVGEYTPSVLAECLDVTDEQGNIIQESGYLEIDKTTFDNLEAHKIEWDIAKQKFVDVAPPTKAEIEAQKKAEYESKVQSLLLARGYDKDRQIAILCNRGTSEAHDKEFEDMQAVREQCKAEARRIIYD